MMPPARRQPPPRRASPAPSRKRERRRSDLFSRVAIAVPAAFLAIVIDNVGGAAWMCLMIALGGTCLYELYRMLDRWKPVEAVGFLALAGMCVAANYGTERVVVEIALAAIPATFLVIVARGQHGGATVSVAGTLLGVFWLAFAFSHAVLLRHLPHGGGVTIDVMVGTFLADTAAYFGGRLFGRRPLAPEISPKKTVEGLVCGMLIAILSVYVAGLYQPWLTQLDAFGLGLAIAVLGPLGDLFESLIKRDAGTKDAGTMFGAHGGALDRLDAVIFTIVAAYFIWAALV
jgi:phosphatidate cytidylyltransferase